MFRTTICLIAWVAVAQSYAATGTTTKTGVAPATKKTATTHAAHAAQAAPSHPMLPLEDAASRGYKECKVLDSIMRPLYDSALPRKDYRALMQAAPAIAAEFDSLLGMKYQTHNTFKYNAYKERLANLKQTVKRFSDAATAGDTAAVFSQFLPMHDEMQKTISAILPLPWKEFEDLNKLARNLAADKMVREGVDLTPIEAKVDKIQGALDKFKLSPAPAEIKEREKLIADEQAYFTKVVADMKSNLSHDIPKFKLKATELQVRLGTFEYMYLQ